METLSSWTRCSAINSFLFSPSSLENNPKLLASHLPFTQKTLFHLQETRRAQEESWPLHSQGQKMKLKLKMKWKKKRKVKLKKEDKIVMELSQQGENNGKHEGLVGGMVSSSSERGFHPEIITHMMHNSNPAKIVVNEKKEKIDVQINQNVCEINANHVKGFQSAVIHTMHTSKKVMVSKEKEKRKRKDHNERLNNDSKDELLGEILSSLERGLCPEPSLDSFIHMMHRCRKEKDIVNANRLYRYMQSKGVETHGSLCNYLVPMLVEAGLIDEAHRVFNNMEAKNEFSWTCLISAYVRVGKPTQALNLYHDMLQDDSVLPNGYTIVAALKACSNLKDLKCGTSIHARLVGTSWLEKDLFVGNTLIDMYAKCGSLSRACEVFDNLLVRDVVSWNALITGYIEQGQASHALKCFERMQMEEEVYPNSVTIICCSKACGNTGNIVKGRELHMLTVKNGLDTDLTVNRTFVDMYAKCGSLTESRQVLSKLPIQNVVSWTALIGGYANYGNNEEALKCYQSMRNQGIFPDAITLVHCLRACGNSGATEKALEIHAEIARKGLLDTNVVISNSLLDMYVKCGSLTKAQEVFDKIPIRDVISWTSLIAGYAGIGDGQYAIHLFEKMKIEGISPNAITYVCLLSACGSIGAVTKGQEICHEIDRQGLLERDHLLGNAIVDMYAKCGLLKAAQEVFNKLPYRDIVSWTSLMAGYLEYGYSEKVFECYKQMHLERISSDAVTTLYILKACVNIQDSNKGREIHSEIACKGLLECDIAIGVALIDMYGKCGLIPEAEDVFDKLLMRDTVAWNALLASYVEHQRCEDVFKCLESMQIDGVVQDSVTFVCILKACAISGAAHIGQEIHRQIEKGELLERDSVICNALLDMYIKCGLLGEAREVFENLSFRNVVTYTALITGYSQLGESGIVFDFLDRMIIEGIKPNSVTFISILGVCCHEGLVEKGEVLFHAMCEIHRINPSPQHLTCMVDLLGRAGQLEKAVELIKKMLFLVDDSVWHSVLAACQRWGNVELGRQAFEYAMGLDIGDVAAYVSLSNLYADVDIEDRER